MQHYGFAVYIILFIAIFCETGLVITPFLPGDSLIFASGALAAIPGGMSWVALPLFIIAAITGNMLNYQIGHFFSERVRSRKKIRFIKQEYIDRTEKFFDKHGGATIIITRFMPILRTFSPFVAGVGEMPYLRFLLFNAISGISWASAFFLIGLFFGNMPYVSSHFSFIVVGIVFISLIPAVVAFLQSRRSMQTRK
jgi:membrane-associated protein